MTTHTVLFLSCLSALIGAVVGLWFGKSRYQNIREQALMLARERRETIAPRTHLAVFMTEVGTYVSTVAGAIAISVFAAMCSYAYAFERGTRIPLSAKGLSANFILTALLTAALQLLILHLNVRSIKDQRTRQTELNRSRRYDRRTPEFTSGIDD